jgi:riboflavin kinase/FMN adenylyltransferase
MVSDERRFAAIGNFDGVHRGHQLLLAETIQAAAEMGGVAGVVVFEPHPRRFFRPDDPPFLLTTRLRRASLLYEAGAEFVIELPFDAALVALAPEDFVRKIIKDRLGLSGVAVGNDFRFGNGRSGDADGLKRLCGEAGIAAKIVAPLMDGSEKYGSTAIRAALQRGEVESAAAMLGRPWDVEGPVIEGRKLGRTIGFATANMTLGDLVEPRRGVYAVRATVRGRTYDGVANFGRRPTFGEGAPLLETHLFDYAGDLYGEALRVGFVDFLRDEKKFDGLEALKAQITDDCRAARAALIRTGPM